MGISISFNVLGKKLTALQRPRLSRAIRYVLPNATTDQHWTNILMFQGVQKERIHPSHIFVLPFQQTAVPKPGSKRDFLRIPSQKVRALSYMFCLVELMSCRGAGVERVGLHAALLECVHDAGCARLHSHSFSARRYAAPFDLPVGSISFKLSHSHAHPPSSR